MEKPNTPPLLRSSGMSIPNITTYAPAIACTDNGPFSARDLIEIRQFERDLKAEVSKSTCQNPPRGKKHQSFLKRRFGLGTFTCRGLCLRLCPNRGADRRHRNALVRFIKRRGVVELRHFRLTRVMQRDDVPAVFVEHRTAGASPFSRCPVVHAAVAARDHDVVVEGEENPASASVADDVEPPSPLWRRHRQRFV